MNKAVKIILLSLLVCFLGSGAAWWSARHFVLRTVPGIVILEKRFLTFTDSFVDCRDWKAVLFDAHPEIKHALATQGFRDYLTDLKAEEYQAMVKNENASVREKTLGVLGSTEQKVSEIQETIRQKAKDWLKD